MYRTFMNVLLFVAAITENPWTFALIAVYVIEEAIRDLA